MATIAAQLRAAQATLSLVTDVPALEADLLLAHVLKKSRSYLWAEQNQVLDVRQQVAFLEFIEKRAKGEPVAYLIGSKEFWSLDFKVTPAVLIPRPETELLVELVLAHAGKNKIRLADLGTGSGAIAISIAHERPAWDVVATDQSLGALEIAKENALRLGVSPITFLQGSWCQPLQASSFHVIVANPPYLAETDEHLTAGGLAFEPLSALVSGAEGLTAIEAILMDAERCLMPGGALLIEHGYAQGQAVRDLFAAFGFKNIQTYCDLAGLERVTKGLTREGFGVYSHAGVL